MRYNEGRSKGEKHAQFLLHFRFTFCYFRTFLQATFVTVNEVIRFVIIYLGVKTLRHLTLYRTAGSNPMAVLVGFIK